MSRGERKGGASVHGEAIRGLALAFFTALGVILGGALIGSLPGFLTPEPPFYRMQKLATDMKLWAVVVALGGTWPTLRAVDSGLFQGDVAALVRQGMTIAASLCGAQVGYWIIFTLTGGEGP